MSNAQLNLRNQTAKVLISGTRSNQKRKPASTWEILISCGDGALPRHHTRNFRPDMRLELNLFCGQMEAWRTVHSIPIEQCHRRHSEVDRKSTRLNSSHLGISY